MSKSGGLAKTAVTGGLVAFGATVSIGLIATSIFTFIMIPVLVFASIVAHVATELNPALALVDCFTTQISCNFDGGAASSYGTVSGTQTTGTQNSGMGKWSLGPAAPGTVGGDDYPFKAQAALYLCVGDQPCASSPYGGYYGECVDFVAYRLNRDAGTLSNPKFGGLGSALTWATRWEERGWSTSSTPKVGDVAWWPPFTGGSGTAGHVAYVAHVDGDTVTLEEYNALIRHTYHTRIVNASYVVLYLVPPKF